MWDRKPMATQWYPFKFNFSYLYIGMASFNAISASYTTDFAMF